MGKYDHIEGLEKILTELAIKLDRDHVHHTRKRSDRYVRDIYGDQIEQAAQELLIWHFEELRRSHLVPESVSQDKPANQG